MPKRIPMPKDNVQSVLMTNIAYECNVRGITDEQLCKFFGWSKSTYNKRRHNPGDISIEELQRFCKQINIPVITLFEDKNSRNKKLDLGQSNFKDLLENLNLNICNLNSILRGE